MVFFHYFLFTLSSFLLFENMNSKSLTECHGVLKWCPVAQAIFFCFLQNMLLCIMGKLVCGGSVAVAVAFGASDRWQMTRKKWHVTCDRWPATHDIFLSYFNFLSVSVHFVVGATSRTRRKIQCLLHAGFYLFVLIIATIWGLSPQDINTYH